MSVTFFLSLRNPDAGCRQNVCSLAMGSSLGRSNVEFSFPLVLILIYKVFISILYNHFCIII